MANLLLTANQMLASGISKEFHDLVKSISECQSRQVRHRNTGALRSWILPQLDANAIGQMTAP